MYIIIHVYIRIYEYMVEVGIEGGLIGQKGHTTHFPKISFKLYLAMTLGSCFLPNKGIVNNDTDFIHYKVKKKNH